MTALHWAAAHPYLTATAAAVTLAALVLCLRGITRGIRNIRGRAPAAVIVAAIAAIACTAYSADTSWRFTAHWLGMVAVAERAALFTVGELAIFASATMAWHNKRTTGEPGAPGAIVWCVTGVQTLACYAEGGLVGGTVRAAFGPILAAVLWHFAMGIDLRHAKPGAHSNGLLAILAREARERLLSRLGLATRGRDAEQITRDRWTVRAVSYAAQLADIPDVKRHSRKARRLARRLSVAVGRAGAGADEQQRRMLLELLAARRHATALATVALPSPWAEEVRRRASEAEARTEAEAKREAEARRVAEEKRQAEEEARRLAEAEAAAKLAEIEARRRAAEAEAEARIAAIEQQRREAEIAAELKRQAEAAEVARRMAAAERDKAEAARLRAEEEARREAEERRRRAATATRSATPATGAPTATATAATPSATRAATTATPATPSPTRSATAATQSATNGATPPATTATAATSRPDRHATPVAATKPATDGAVPYDPGTPQHVVYGLWMTLGHRPSGPRIVQALGQAGLPNSEQQARKIRLQVQREHPDLPGPRAA